MTASPYAAELEESEVNQAADEDFWARVRTALASLQTGSAAVPSRAWAVRAGGQPGGRPTPLLGCRRAGRGGR